jgi:hypothetical protein
MAMGRIIDLAINRARNGRDDAGGVPVTTIPVVKFVIFRNSYGTMRSAAMAIAAKHALAQYNLLLSPGPA